MGAANHLPAGILPDHVDMAAINALATEYALGIPAIDDQHRLLFGWCVALRTAPDVRPVLRALLAYAITHFQDEERWALDHGVDVETHHAQHVELVQRLEEQLRLPKLSRMEVQAMAFDWLTVHIDVEDRSLVMAADLDLDD